MPLLSHITEVSKSSTEEEAGTSTVNVIVCDSCIFETVETALRVVDLLSQEPRTTLRKPALRKPAASAAVPTAPEHEEEVPKPEPVPKKMLPRKRPAADLAKPKVGSPAYYKNNNSFGIKIDGKELLRVALSRLMFLCHQGKPLAIGIVCGACADIRCSCSYSHPV